ncbi:unnamed protein product [Didymodactylos carnosus]|uniref:G-protein coupled receptors family 1 profile domain-containing protein n=1 Tax=Didymodactylos carnosus TaxID=1234261 RepID=A0A814I3W4_9BILA|nr:unnamed protein product [Didymodactylos carnosus]CAF1331345.1 unnamed protein product [Didymodactylos carnosus]CAF3790277.1 unnamed protein product [Didymodactylos carnosus]CAF4142784.1 unnamed protein product [Didymodactylos carnosus]
MTTTQLQSVVDQLNRYMTMVLLMVMMIFTRKSLRTNPTSTYLLASTFPNCIALLAVSPRIVDSYAIYPTQLGLYCKLRIFFSFSSLTLTSWFIVLACVDRYVASSKDVQIRSFSSVKIAKRAIILMTILICSLFSPMFYCIEGSLVLGIFNCIGTTPTCQRFNTFTTLISLALLPPLLMLIFGLLTVRNVRLVGRQTVPLPTTTVAVSSRTKNRDRQLMIMLLAQVASATMFILPFSIQRFYTVLTASVVKSDERKDLENFLYNFSNLLQFVNNTTSFYLFTLTGTIFRQELKRLVFYYLPRMSVTNETSAAATGRKTQLELLTIKH